MKNILLRSFVVFCAVITTCYANDEWVGNGGNWSTGANWLSGTAPASTYGTTLSWNNNGLGGVSVMDQDWRVRYLMFTNSSLTARHVLDLDGNTLEVYGYIWDGYRTTDSSLTITNGTLQLGHTGYTTSLLVGYERYSFDNVYTGHTVVISADINAIGWGSLLVGYCLGTYWPPSHISGSLDMSGCSISSDGVVNKIKCANFAVGGGGLGTYGEGVLEIPSAITAIETGDFIVGGDGYGYGRGVLDLGAGSQLTNIIATTKFWLGAGSVGIISNWPSVVNLQVGTPSSSASFRVGAGRNVRTRPGLGGSLVVSNAVVDGYLSELLIGTILGYDSSNHTITGVLDLAQAQLNTGYESNALITDDLRIGGLYIRPDYYQGGQGIGTLRLPSALTKVETGIFQLGASVRGMGTLDFGTNAHLDTFIVTNNFYYGTEGSIAKIIGVPTNGVVFTVGRTNSYVTMYMARDTVRANGYSGYSDLVLTNVNFSAYLKELEIGVGHDTSQNYDWRANGKLDLSKSTLNVMDVSGNVTIGRGDDANTVKNGVGRLLLHAGIMNISSNLYLGDNGGNSLGILTLDGTEAVIDGIADIRESGIVTTLVSGVSCGLDITTDAESSLSISNGATISVTFDADPVEPANSYWGLRMAGDHVSYLQSLVSGGRLVIENNMSSEYDSSFGIKYDSVDDKTIVGLLGQQGTLLILL